MPYPTSTEASGIWTLKEALRFTAAGEWPPAVTFAITSEDGEPLQTEAGELLQQQEAT